MTKKFGDNKQTCHVWAQQNEPEGASKGGNIFFEGATIYSYGYHFPMATYIDNNTVLINSDSASVTTGKQQRYVRNAIGVNALRTNTAMLKEIIKLREIAENKYNDKKEVKLYTANQKKRIQTLAIEQIQTAILNAAQSAGRRKKASLIVNEINSARHYFNNHAKLLSFFNIKLPKKVENAVIRLEANYKEVIAAHQKEVAATKRKNEKANAAYNKEQAILAKKAVTLWLNNEHLDYKMQRAMEHHSAIIYMRVNGEKIETTKGAKFPVDDAKKLFPKIKYCLDRGLSWSKDAVLPLNPLGHFTIDYIDAKGNVKAGCHFVEWTQIERVAQQLNLI